MSAAQRRGFVVGQVVAITISLVGRSNHNLLNQRTAPTGFQQCPGARDIGFHRRHRITIRRADNGLGRQMKHGLDLVFVESALK